MPLPAMISVMPQLRIADLLANMLIDPEAHLDAARVKRYAAMLDTLLPVVVFDTGEELLLADGYHRLAAARRCGLETVALHSTVSPPTRPSRTSGDEFPRVYF